MDATRLRERNRSLNVAAVQEVALALIGARGFDGVTVSEIAENAGVSPSTVYRYFGTKEALVLSGDGTDGLLPALVAAAGAHPQATRSDLFGLALDTLLNDVDDQALLQRVHLVFADPGLTAAFEHEILGRRHAVADAFAAHRNAASPGARDVAAAGALLGMFVAVLDRWQRTGGKKSLLKMLTKAAATIS